MRRARFDRINIVPFVDIVLVLLVIVLATATFAQQGRLEVDLPEGNTTVPTPHTPTVITLDANGSYFLADQPIRWEALQDRIATMEHNTTLLLRTDKATPFHYFAQLIAALKARAITHVSIATQQP